MSWLVVARFLSRHGLHGYLKLQSLSGFDSHIRAGKRAWITAQGRTREQKILKVRGAPGNLIMALEGVNTPEDARKYRGAEIAVAQEQALPRRAGEYYYADLVTCEVFFGSECRGVVRAVWENHCDMLEVEVRDGRVVQLPFQDQFVAEVNIHRKRIALKVDWILE